MSKSYSLPEFVNRGSKSSYILSMSTEDDATECYKSTMMGLGTPAVCPHERINKVCVNAYGMHLMSRIPYFVTDELRELTIAFVGAAQVKKQDPATIFQMEMSKGGQIDKNMVESLKGTDYRVIPPAIFIPLRYSFFYVMNPVGQTAQAIYVAQQMNDWNAGKVNTDVITSERWPRAEAMFAEFIIFAEKKGCPLDKITELDRAMLARYPDGWDSLPESEKYDVPEVTPGIYSVVHKHAPYTPTMRL
jgi:hypothetical protein